LRVQHIVSSDVDENCPGLIHAALHTIEVCL
jgi:hypothetical protein